MMKTKLLKMALCAMMLVPIGAAAEVTNKTWDFTSWSETTLTNLVAGVYDGSTNTSGEWTFDNNIYSLKALGGGSTQTLTANSIAISEFSGLTFNWPNADGRIKIYNGAGSPSRTGLYLNSAIGNEKVNIPVIAGKKISIVMESMNSGNPTRMNCSNANVVAINQKTVANHPMGTRVTDVFVVNPFITTETTVSFGGETNGRPLMIYSITIEDATDEEMLATFGDDTVITTNTLWTFDQFQNGDALSAGSTYNYAGLYMKGNDSSTKVTAATNSKTLTFGDYTVATNYLASSAGGRGLSNFTTNQKASAIVTAKDGGMAINTGVAGTMYVYITNRASVAKNLNLVFNGTTVHTVSAAAYSSSTDPTCLTYTSTVPGTFFFHGEGSYFIHAVKFVPTSSTPLNKTITMSDMGVMTFSSQQAWTLPSGLKAFATRSSVTDGKLTLKEITGTIPACTGVILQGTHSQEYTLTQSDASSFNFNTAEAPRYCDVNYSFRPVIADYALQQTYPANSDASGNSGSVWNNYILAKSDDSMVFALSSGSGSLAAGKAYFSIRQDQIKTSGEARYFTLDFGGESTGINSVENGQLVIDNVVYNLSGQRVDSNYKGLVIKNGKKVIIK